MSRTAHIIAAAGVLVSALAALPGFVGLAKGEGVTQPYRDLLGASMTGDTPPSPADTTRLTARPAPPAASTAPAPAATAPAPIGPEGLLMQRLAQDPRLSMRVVAVTPYPGSSRLLNARFELASSGGDSVVFSDYDGLQRSWGLDGDRAGNCWQQRQTGLAIFSAEDLPSQEPTWLAAGASVSITGTYQCDNDVVAGDVFTAITRPMLVAGEGVTAAARPVQFRSPPFVLQ